MKRDRASLAGAIIRPKPHKPEYWIHLDRSIESGIAARVDRDFQKKPNVILEALNEAAGPMAAQLVRDLAKLKTMRPDISVAVELSARFVGYAVDGLVLALNKPKLMRLHEQGTMALSALDNDIDKIQKLKRNTFNLFASVGEGNEFSEVERAALNTAMAQYDTDLLILRAQKRYVKSRLAEIEVRLRER